MDELLGESGQKEEIPPIPFRLAYELNKKECEELELLAEK